MWDRVCGATATALLCRDLFLFQGVAVEIGKQRYIVDNAVMPNVSAPSQYPQGRVCSYEGCDTKLSRYNSLGKCAIHSGISRSL